MGRRLRILAPAKINLTLEVTGRRADGYHELASVMTTLELQDDVRVAVARDLEVALRPDVGAPPGDDLATRAVHALARATGHDPAAHVVVRKRIPVAAGLGGGSSDAGAVLRALATLWRVGDVDLVAVAASVGSDVPFFAAAQPVARISGRGEKVEGLPRPSPPIHVALVTLPSRSSTREVFAALDRSAWSGGDATAELARLLRDGRATPAAIRSVARNDLSAAAERVNPAVRAARAAARDAGIELCLSGSGPSLFAVADDRAHALRMVRALRRAGLRATARTCAVDAPMLRV